MRRTNMTALSAVVIAAVMTTASCSASDDGVSQSAAERGQFSAYSRQDLRTLWKNSDQFPLMVPIEMPAGSDGEDEPGFDLGTTNLEAGPPDGRRRWLSFYDARVLDTEDVQVRILQRGTGTAPLASGPCGGDVELPHIERTIDEAVLTICGLSLAENEDARQYWSTVEFTTDYDKVPWLY